MKRRDFIQSSLVGAAVSIAGIRGAYAVARAGATPDVAAVTGDKREVLLRGTQIADFASQLHGQLLLAGDSGYDDARRILNPSFDKRPALIARVTDVADVQTAVRFARAHDLLVAVKCGGHSHSGQSTCDRGLLIDLSTFRNVRVDRGTQRVWATGGTLLGQIDHATLPLGLVAPLGTVSHTGVGGLTLGGGFGRVARRFGMSIDSLESVDIVTADGQLRRASASENPDLYWGVRGGGGNFGIVTSFEFRLHPMQRDVIAGRVTFPLARARDVMTMFAEYASVAPDELDMGPTLMLPPGGAPGSVSFDVCYSGPHKDAERVLAPVRKLGKPDSDTIKVMDYEVVQRSGDVSDPRAMGTYIKSGFISAISPELISSAIENFQGNPGRATLLFFQLSGGACGRVQNGATAFAHRDALANMMAMAGWRHGDDPAQHMQSTRQYWSKLERFTRGFYVNDIAREATPTDVNQNYRDNYEKLVALKTKYDPTNLFRLNANVQPMKA